MTAPTPRFENRVQELTHHKLVEYLKELFEDFYLDPENDHFYVQYGSTILEISNEPHADEESVVTIMSYCVQGVDADEELLRGLLRLNHDTPFGSFSLVGRDIFVSHSLFGQTLHRSNLLNAISAVATLSDDYDDRITSKFGGRTALQRIRDTGGRRHRASQARAQSAAASAEKAPRDAG